MRWGFGYTVAAACVTVGLGLATPAAGQQGSAGYREAIELAIKEFGASAYPEARAAFRRAHRIFPNARTLRGLGLVEFELRHYRRCVEYLEQALASPVRALDESLRASTQAVLDKARGYLVELELEVSPADAKVLLDGIPVTRDETGGVIVQVGDHVIHVQAEGHVAVQRRITIEGGQAQHVRIELSPSVVPSAAMVSSSSPQSQPPPDVVRDDDDGPVYTRWWFWTAVVVVAAGAAVTGVALASTSDDAPVGTDIPGAFRAMALRAP